jgi:hypothetical protein
MKFDFSLGRANGAEQIFTGRASQAWLSRIADSDDQYPKIPDFPHCFATTLSVRRERRPIYRSLTIHPAKPAYRMNAGKPSTNRIGNAI